MVSNLSSVFPSYFEYSSVQVEFARTLTAVKGFSQRGLMDKECPCHLETLRQTETAPRGRLTHSIVLQAETNTPRDRIDDACSASSFNKNTTCGLKMKKYPYRIRKTLYTFLVTFFTNHFILTFLWVKCVISIIVEITLLNNQLIRFKKSLSFSFYEQSPTLNRFIRNDLHRG